MRTPLLDMLKEKTGRSWLHMPGHGGAMPWLDARLDTTELGGTDDLMEPRAGGPIEGAQRLAAQAAGAAQTLFLAGGSTLGIHAMLLAFAAQGDAVLLPRNAHKSAHAACVLGGLVPISVPVRVENGRAFATEEAFLRAIQAHPQARAVLVTRPDFYGVCVALERIVAAAQAVGMAVLVDEAHGAHFPYDEKGPLSAGALGADAWVQSAHKTLPALTQSAYLHLRQSDTLPTVRDRIRLLATSSPSFLLLASLDYARAQMQESGVQWMRSAKERVARFFEKIAHTGYTNAQREWGRDGCLCDETRAVIDVRASGLSGYRVQAELTALGIDIEMADPCHIVALPPLGNPSAADAAMDALATALLALVRQMPPFVWEDDPAPIPEQVLPTREAALGARLYLPMALAQGRIAAQAVGLYPPGIPLVLPGERIARETLRAMDGAVQQGAHTFGLDGAGRMPVCVD